MKSWVWSLSLVLSFTVLADGPVIPTPPPGNLCPVPNLAKCQEDGYLQSGCGKMRHAVCSNLLLTEFRTVVSGLPVATDARMGSGASNIRAEVPDYSTYVMTGMEASPAAYHMRNQLFSLKRSNVLTPVEFLWLLIRQGWDNNGNKIESCHEYAYEHFHGLMQFEDRMSKMEHQDRNIYQMAMADPTLQNGLRSKDGAPFAVTFPSGRRPKNKYFSFPLFLWYPSGEGRFQFDPTLAATILRGREYSYNHWIWHSVMGETFGPARDTELRAQYLKQQDYLKLFDARDEVQKRWEASTYALVNRMHRSGATPAVIETAVRWNNSRFISELYNIDSRIQETLIVARNEGCLNLNDPTICDWSPELFVDMLKESIAKMRNNEHKRCMTYTNNNFSPESRIVQRGGDVGSSAAYRYFIEYAAQLANLPFTPNPSTGKPLVGEEHSDNTSFGNKYFGMGYNYESSWNVGDFQKNTEKSCDATMGLRSRFNGTVRLFGETFTILDARGDIGTRKAALNPTAREVHAGLSVKVFGNDLLTPIDQTGTVELSVSKDNLSIEKSAGVSQTVIIVAIPVTFSVGMSGKLGVRSEMGADFNRDCARDVLQLNLSAALGPFVSVGGYASAAVDLVAVEIGVRGELTLLDLSLPFTMQANIKPMGGELVLASKAGLDLVVKTMSGRVLLYIDYTVDEAHVTIASWKGKKEVFPLMQNKPIKDVSLNLIKLQ